MHRRFGADELWNYEVGTKLSLFGDRLRLRAAGFYSAWRNIQTDQFLISGLSYTANAGDGHNLGLESEAQVRLTPAWTLEGNLLLDQPVLDKPNPGFLWRRRSPLARRCPTSWAARAPTTALHPAVGASDAAWSRPTPAISVARS